uniref:Uncharacterized protein n=1 Tax=Lotharella globosa TaxID=91324 RepID=A0A7S3YE29_9EUKA
MADAAALLLWKPLQLAAEAGPVGDASGSSNQGKGKQPLGKAAAAASSVSTSEASAASAPAAAAGGKGGSDQSSWKERDSKLKAFMDKLPNNFDYRVSFEDGKFAFVDSKNIVLAQAKVKLLMSYNLVKKSVVGGWANPSVPKQYVGTEVKGIKNVDAEPKESDNMAHQIADASGCRYVYKAVNRANWVYLGLADLKMVDPKQRVPFNSTTGYLELVVMIIARLRKVIMMKQVQPVSIAKAYHDAGFLFFQQAKTTFRCVQQK